MRDKQSTLRHLVTIVFLFSAIACGQQRANPINIPGNGRAQGIVLKDVPATADVKAKYLFYLRHAVLYKPMKEWVDLVVEWAKP